VLQYTTSIKDRAIQENEDSGKKQVVELTYKLIESLIIQKKQELQGVIDYPDNKLSSIIREIGFKCDLCGKCCTAEFNDHVFLLDIDSARIKQIAPNALVPAPYYEFCDRQGRFYVSGYALKCRPDGSCIFLKQGRCSIYAQRLTICRIYPYMLHWEADEDGNMEWRQISGLNEHGCYHTEIKERQCRQIALETKEYERSCLEQEIGFLEAVYVHFVENGLRHVQGIYDKQMRQFQTGSEIEVLVYYNGGLEKNLMRISDFISGGNHSPDQ
jgi:Fe-S-cluster containining protein